MLSVSDEDDNAATNVPSDRPTGYRQTGRWIRLDANGDEISGNERGHVNSVSLGWSWASSLESATQDDEKPVISNTLAISNTVRNDTPSTLNAGTGTFPSRDIVGR